MKLSTQHLMDLPHPRGGGDRGRVAEGRRVGRIYENPALAPAELDPKLTVLSLDIETDARARIVYAVALVFHDPATGHTRRRGPPQRRRGPPTARCFPFRGGHAGAPCARASSSWIRTSSRDGTSWISTSACSPAGSPRLGVPFDIGRSDSAGQLPRPGGHGRHHALEPEQGDRPGPAGARRAVAGAHGRHGPGGLPPGDRGAERAGPGQADRRAARGNADRRRGAAVPRRTPRACASTAWRTRGSRWRYCRRRGCWTSPCASPCSSAPRWSRPR